MIFEGLHTLFLNNVVDAFDLKIFMKPNEQLRQYWKIQRDSQKRQQSKDKIVEMIQKRQKDAEKYIYQQEYKSDVIISWETDVHLSDVTDNKTISTYLIITVSNHINITSFLQQVEANNLIQLNHDYIENDKQRCTIKSINASVSLEPYIRHYEQKLFHLGLFKPQWTSGLEGVLQLLLCEIMLDIVEHSRK